MKLLVPTVFATLTLLGGNAAANSPLTSPPRPGTAAYQQWIATSLARLQRLADEDALRNLAYAYGRGNDAISILHGDRVKARAAGAAEYAKGMAGDIKIEVYALGGESPFNATTGIPAWVNFVDKYFEAQRYTSTIHQMSNFAIEFVDADTATVSAYAVVPHFINSGAKEKSGADGNVDIMNCKYRFQAKRQKDGSWKTVALRIELQDIWRGVGFFPGGQGKGL